MEQAYPAEYSPKMMREMRRAAAAIRRAGSVLVVTHIDADGITSGAIADTVLTRLGKEHEVRFEKKIAEETIGMINASKADIVWICDLGSAYMSRFTRDGVVVTDHHVPDPQWRSGQSVLDGFMDSYQMNPHLYGLSGSYEVCGAGMTYLLGKEIDPANADLAHLAVVGAIGDFQDTRENRLVSYNRLILKDAVDRGDVTVSKGIRYFGRESRPLIQFLQYGGEPRIGGITDDRDGCFDLLCRYNVSDRDGSGRRLTWVDLDPVDRAVLADDLMGRVSEEERAQLFGEVYTINRYDVHSGLHDAKEFATVLNSCGRYDDARTGERLCMGDLGALKDAERNRAEHRRNISSSLAMVRDRHMVRQRRRIQFFDAGTEIRETVVGIVAGMVLNSDEADKTKPIIAFAEADDGAKVSARAPKSLTDRGLDLSAVMHDAAAAVGGMGGGHSVAAGATIPEDRKEEFLDRVEEIVSAQLSGS